jgi:hypothetical protein
MILARLLVALTPSLSPERERVRERAQYAKDAK